MLCFSSVCNVCAILLSLFTVTHGLIGNLISVVVALPAHRLYHFCKDWPDYACAE